MRRPSYGLVSFKYAMEERGYTMLIWLVDKGAKAPCRDRHMLKEAGKAGFGSHGVMVRAVKNQVLHGFVRRQLCPTRLTTVAA